MKMVSSTITTFLLALALSCTHIFAGELETKSTKERLILLTGEWPPYTSEKMQGYGVQAALVAAAVDEMGYHPEFIFLPWKRCESMLKQGDAFAAFPYTFTDKRRELFDFSDTIFVTTTNLFYYKPHMTKVVYESLEELRPYSIGGVLGYSYVPLLETAELKLRLVPRDEQLIPMLRMERVDLVAMDQVNGWLEIDKHYPSSREYFGYLDKPVRGSSPSMLMVSRDYPASSKLTTEFNAALTQIRKNGVYDAVLTSFNIPITDQ